MKAKTKKRNLGFRFRWEGRGGGNSDAQLLPPRRSRVPGKAADMQPQRGEGEKSRGFRQSAGRLWMLSQREIQMLALAVSFLYALCAFKG